MSIDKESIQERLKKLSEVIRLLEQYKETNRADFLVDFTINSATQFNLILGIEIIVDIGAHFLSEVYQVRAGEYREVLLALGEKGITPHQFANEHADMARFRNLIIHQYSDVDMRQVYDNLQKAPDTFRAFAQYFVDFLEKQE
jgi:uncharacterized protein YutE (UPF0331/DUF86 family)